MSSVPVSETPLEFVHLHNHSDFSLLDGAVKIPWYIEKVKEMGMKHLALTDHGNLFGALHFEKACHEAGINPIIGCEAYIAHGDARDKTPDPRITSRKRYHYHMVLYCKNQTGYHNLVKLVSLANTRGYYYKPRMDDGLLREYSDGLMASTACLGGEIPQLVLAGKPELAEERALFYNELFGPGNFWLEIMNHQIPEEETVRNALIGISRKTGIPLIATNDIHYLEKEHAEAHDALCCIGMKQTVTNQNRKRMKLDQPEFYFKSAEQMYELFPDVPEALRNTVRLAEKCDLRIPEPGPILPAYQIPESYQSHEIYFRDLVRENALERYGDPLPPEVSERLESELGTVCKLDYIGYFLIVWDFIQWAKKNGISVGPGRGSGAGSMIAYVLGITDLEPIKYNLLFERFLNEERVSMPDFDIDFCFERRGEVIEYVKQRYGEENVAGICTFGTFKTKAVLKDVARVLNIPFEQANTLTSLMSDNAKNLQVALEQEPLLQEYQDRGAEYEKLFQIAGILEGMNRHVSTHACGIVIGREPISEYVPLLKDKNNTISTQYTMDLIESCGLVKMDFLGLKTLTLLDKIELLVRKWKPDFSFSEIPEDDPATFAMLGAGGSKAVFQFESEGMQKILIEAKPSSIEDLIALNALYRPGPMQFIQQFIKSKQDPKKIVYPDPSLKKTLEPTYGVIVYQEQVMEIARIIGNFSLGKADIMRRAMGKKKEKEMDSLKAEFLEGAIQKGYQRAKAEEIFEMLKPFAGYGFNKSHAAAYSILAYKTAYSRANYPVEFMAANLTNEIGNPTAFRSYIQELNNLRIELIPPNINLSERYFTVQDGKIIFGLQAIKNLGGAAVEEILQCRGQGGKFLSFLDFMERVDPHKVNRKTVETLIFAGVFQGVERKYNYATMLGNLDQLIAKFGKNREDNKQANLFGEFAEEIAREVQMEMYDELPPGDILQAEHELLGIYISGHPLEKYRTYWRRAATLALHENLRLDSPEYKGKKQTVVVMITEKRVITTKQGKTMVTLLLEDFHGRIPAVIFPKTLDKKTDSGIPYLELIQNQDCVCARGTLERRSGKDWQLNIETLYPVEEAPIKPNAQVHLHIESAENARRWQEVETAEAFRSLLYQFQGNSPLFFHVRPGDGNEYVLEASHNIRLDPSQKLEQVILENEFFPVKAIEFV